MVMALMFLRKVVQVKMVLFMWMSMFAQSVVRWHVEMVAMMLVASLRRKVMLAVLMSVANTGSATVFKVTMKKVRPTTGPHYRWFQ